MCHKPGQPVNNWTTQYINLSMICPLISVVWGHGSIILRHFAASFAIRGCFYACWLPIGMTFFILKSKWRKQLQAEILKYIFNFDFRTIWYFSLQFNFLLPSQDLLLFIISNPGVTRYIHCILIPTHGAGSIHSAFVIHCIPCVEMTSIMLHSSACKKSQNQVSSSGEQY